MEVDGDYPEERTSDHVNQACGHDILSLSKKRKFLAETKEQLSLQASKYVCCETLVEHDPFSKESFQAKVFYTHRRADKTSINEVDEDTGAESAEDSNSTAGEANTYDVSSSSSSHSRAAISKSSFYLMNSTTMTCSAPSNDEFQGGRIDKDNLDESQGGRISEDSLDESQAVRIHEDNLDVSLVGGIQEDTHDEFGECLGYLASACGNDSKSHTDEEIEEFLYLNGMVPNSYLPSERLTAEQESQSGARKPTIDQEFEQYFSMLMM